MTGTLVVASVLQGLGHCASSNWRILELCKVAQAASHQPAHYSISIYTCSRFKEAASARNPLLIYFSCISRPGSLHRRRRSTAEVPRRAHAAAGGQPDTQDLLQVLGLSGEERHGEAAGAVGLLSILPRLQCRMLCFISHLIHRFHPVPSWELKGVLSCSAKADAGTPIPAGPPCQQLNILDNGLNILDNPHVGAAVR